MRQGHQEHCWCCVKSAADLDISNMDPSLLALKTSSHKVKKVNISRVCDFSSLSYMCR